MLTHAGTATVGAAVSGVYTETETELEDAVFGECSRPDCDGTPIANYGGGHVSPESEEPVRVTVSVTAAGETRTVTLDEHLDIVDVCRDEA